MKHSFKIVLLIFSSLQTCIFAQAGTESFGIKVSGFVKNDFFYDSRQVVSIREGHFLLYPSPENLDAAKNDINAEPNFNFLSIQTRLTGSISAPDAFGAKVSGVVEADFFGNENANFIDVNGFRLRHAFAKLSWDNTELLLGQYWHPLFIPANYSEVLSFNTGAPMQPFSRNPQIRITQKLGAFSLIGVAAAQRDFTSPGGTNSLRNSAIPDLHAQIQFENKNSNAEILAGLGGGYKSLKPQLNTEKDGVKYITDETVSGISATAFFKIKLPAFTYKIQGVYGQNLFDAIMLGGYTACGVIDSNKNTLEYTTINNLAVWSELIKNIDNIQVGLWAGYTENLGASENIIALSSATVRGSDIKNVLRISPRIVFMSEKFNLGVETEYTSAAYAVKQNGVTTCDQKGAITETSTVSNLRVLFSAILKF